MPHTIGLLHEYFLGGIRCECSRIHITEFFTRCAQNLQGQGEIIGVADTGLDMYHCQFSEDHGMPVKASDWNNPITDTTKRKVVQYIKYADDLDGETQL